MPARANVSIVQNSASRRPRRSQANQQISAQQTARRRNRRANRSTGQGIAPRGRQTIGGRSAGSVARSLRFLTDPSYAAAMPQPRESAPSGLVPGFSKGISTFTAPASTNYAIFIQYPTVGHIGYSSSQSTPNTVGAAIGTFSNMVPTSSSPAVTQIATDNVKSARLVACISSSSLNCSGLVMFGHIPSDAVNAAFALNWDTLSTLPGVRIVSMPYFSQHPITLFGRKYSTAANSFTGDSVLDDYMCPFVAFFNAGVAQSYMVNMDAAFDVVPYLTSSNTTVTFPQLGLDYDNGMSFDSFNKARHVLAQALPENFANSDTSLNPEGFVRALLSAAPAAMAAYNTAVNSVRTVALRY